MSNDTFSDILCNFAQLEGLTCYDGEDLPDLYVKVGILLYCELLDAKITLL